MPATVAPELTLTAVVSKREIKLNDVSVPTLLLLLSQESGGPLDDIIAAVRAQYPTAEQAQIVSVVDAHKFPKLMHKVAEGMMSGRYHNRAKELPAGRNPEDYIIIIPDWKASAIEALGIESVATKMAIAVLAPGARLIGIDQSDDLSAAALRLLAEATA